MLIVSIASWTTAGPPRSREVIPLGGYEASVKGGNIQRRTSNAGGSSGGSESIAGQLWSVDLNGTIDFDDYDSVGFFMCVDATTTAKVPIMIATAVPVGGTFNVEHSVLYAQDYVVGGDSLSTDWRWVQIPISAYGTVDGGDDVYGGMLVSARIINDEGSFVDTRWNVDFWIDDLYAAIPEPRTYALALGGVVRLATLLFRKKKDAFASLKKG